MSRSAFAARFRDRLGEPPMSYVTAWRMDVAARLVREHELPLARVAERVGYQSEAAFHRAFRRAHGATPGAFARRGPAFPSGLTRPGDPRAENCRPGSRVRPRPSVAVRRLDSDACLRSRRTSSTTATPCPPSASAPIRSRARTARRPSCRALEAGYRLLDTAVNYENETEVGEAVRRSGLPRDEVQVASKLPGPPPRLRRRDRVRPRIARAARPRLPRPAAHPLAQPQPSISTSRPGGHWSSSSRTGWCGPSASPTSPRTTSPGSSTTPA